MARTTTSRAVRDALNDADFPMDKDALVRHLENRAPDPGVLDAVRAIPLAVYENVDEVIASLDTLDT